MRNHSILTLVLLLATVGVGQEAEKEAEGDTWREALPGYVYEFPRDHAAHPEFGTEWWYYTGNLQSADGSRRLGFQLTFFRVGIVYEPEIDSRWALRDLHLTHFAVSDLDTGEFRHFERASRSGVGWAGAATEHYRVWNGDWEARLDGDVHVLTAAEGDTALELRLTPQKPPVIHGEGGISQKGADEGNASHYISLTRLAVSGTVTVGGKPIDVGGLAWMDHEFGTSFLEEGQLGWDWFSLQLEDGRELMLYRFRRDDGKRDPHSSGTLVDVDGRATPLAAGDFDLEPLETWESPATGGQYPVRWRATVPSLDLVLEVDAIFPEQELQTPDSTRVTYWEGAVIARGKQGQTALAARGYLEMTGYAGRALGQAFGK